AATTAAAVAVAVVATAAEAATATRPYRPLHTRTRGRAALSPCPAVVKRRLCGVVRLISLTHWDAHSDAPDRTLRKCIGVGS
ncbi:MAG: hypothetical protein OXC56_07345, partial [Chloroflexi bacterium]|nr:hypothetical protein [Chloroflexota bacterium]